MTCNVERHLIYMLSFQLDIPTVDIARWRRWHPTWSARLVCDILERALQESRDDGHDGAELALGNFITSTVDSFDHGDDRLLLGRT